MNSPKVLELETRRKIFNLVKKHPGAHFREIERKTNMAPSTVKYHLDYLHKHSLLREQKYGNTIRYFSNNIESRNAPLIILLRQESIRKILLYMINNPDTKFSDLTGFTKLSPATISWYLKKLRIKGVIAQRRQNEKIIYSLTIDKKEIIQLLMTYRESFLDSLVNKTLEMWDI